MTDVGLGSLATASVIVAPRGHGTLRRLLRHRSFMIGFSVILLLTLAAVLAPLISPVDPSAMRVRLRFRPPSSQFFFGTDMFGRDVFTRVLYGARVSLFVGIAVCVVSGLCSAIIGVIAAQFRKLDGAIMRLMDALMSFPAILLALGIAAALGPRVSSVIIALTVAYIPAGVRIVRAAALTVREMDFVHAAQVSGIGRIKAQIVPPHSLRARSRQRTVHHWMAWSGRRSARPHEVVGRQRRGDAGTDAPRIARSRAALTELHILDLTRFPDGSRSPERPRKAIRFMASI